jgi:hypothetical protein
LDPTTAITRIHRHNFERIGNQLYFSLQLQPIADFNVQKHEEAELLKGCRSEAHDNVAIDRQREDSGSSEMGFPFFREMKKKLQREQRFQGILKQ